MGCTGSTFWSQKEGKCVSIENYRVQVENNIMLPPSHSHEWDKGAEALGKHLRNIGLPVLGVFSVLLGLGLAIYCAHMMKVKFARAVTNEQYLSNYNYSKMTAVTNNNKQTNSKTLAKPN